MQKLGLKFAKTSCDNLTFFVKSGDIKDFKLKKSCGMYYKHITIVNDDSIMMLQVVASPTINILTNLDGSFMLLANIYSRGVTHDDRHVTIVIYL